MITALFAPMFTPSPSHTAPPSSLPLTWHCQFLSLLPARILKLLEFVGFSVDRAVGLAELEKAAANTTFRAPLCTSFLLFYYTVAAVITGMAVQLIAATLGL